MPDDKYTHMLGKDPRSVDLNILDRQAQEIVELKAERDAAQKAIKFIVEFYESYGCIPVGFERASWLNKHYPNAIPKDGE